MTEYERFVLVFTKTRVYKFGHRTASVHFCDSYPIDVSHPQSNELTRGSPEIVQHFRYRGSSHRRKSPERKDVNTSVDSNRLSEFIPKENVLAHFRTT